uniref:Cilia- and flagella-associated protein HOATZ n=1 Tax=Saccoglossus kowalevskii TaxID=10224 RepID=A0ABM0M9V1_SACKO|nr:PREDICTED: UPF0722 protein-like [Saccoglossus kowalevskii]
MATSTTQIMPDEFTEFVGSSSEDQAYAKVFWQSITLHPPIESRLVSGDIRQRLPVAKPKGTYINKSYKPIQKPPKLTKFLHVSHGQVLQEESLKLMKQAQKREEDLQRLRKRKEERAEIFTEDLTAREILEINYPARINFMGGILSFGEFYISYSYKHSQKAMVYMQSLLSEYGDEQEEEVSDAMQQLDQFDKKINSQDDNDSD